MATSEDFSTSNQYIDYNIDVTVNSQDINTNTSNITVVVKAWRTNNYSTYGSGICYCNINGDSFSEEITTDQVISLNSDTVLFSHTLNIPHNADGTKSIYVSSYIEHSRFSSNEQGFVVNLPTIPRSAVINTFTGGNIEGDISATYTSYYSGFQYKFRISIPFVRELITVNNYVSGTKIRFDSATLNYLYSYMANSKSVNLGGVIETWNGSTKIGESSEIVLTFYITNVNPIISGNLTYADINSTTVALTQNNQQIIQGKSTMQFTVPSATAQKGSSIVKYEITLNQEKRTVNTGTYSWGTIDTSQNIAAVLTVTDSRGYTSQKNVTLTILPYENPYANVTLYRENNFYSTTHLKVSPTYSSLDNKNTITIKYRYKKTSESTYNSYTTISPNTDVTINLNNLYEWNVQVSLQDAITTVLINLVVHKGMPIFYIDRLKNSLGVNCFPSHNNAIEVGGDVFAEDNLVNNNYSTSEVAVGKWIDGSTIYKKTLYSAGGSSRLVNISHGISNLSRVLKAEFSAFDHNFAGVSYVNARLSEDGNYIGIKEISSSYVVMYIDEDFATRIENIYVTLYYTKAS